MEINTFNIRHFFYSFLIVLLSFSNSDSQNQTLILSTPESGNQSHQACEYVDLIPNYSYFPTIGNSMLAGISSQNACSNVYTFNGSGYSGDNPPPRLSNIAVGKINGIFGVSPNGAATYNIPLVIPPGTGSLVPNLSIAYNSNSGNGILGTGWSLQGLSAITRVPQRTYYDNQTEPVTLDQNVLDRTDRFALDGNRLILTPNSPTGYGQLNSTYQTEIETFQLVTASGSASNNDPAFFTVLTKDGRTLVYGGTNDSRIVDGNGNVLTWLISSVTDNVGNYMNFHYINTFATNSEYYYLDYIEYTGNSNSSLSPYNRITFQYGPRFDKLTSFIAGDRLNTNNLLTGITMYANGHVAHNYGFIYSPDFLYSHLISISESGTDGDQINPTTINWHDNLSQPNPINMVVAYGLPQDAFTGNLGITERAMVQGDFNGDGITDVIEEEPTTPDGSYGANWNVYLGNTVAGVPIPSCHFSYQYSGNSTNGFIAQNYYGSWAWNAAEANSTTLLNQLNSGVQPTTSSAGSNTISTDPQSDGVLDYVYTPKYGYSSAVPSLDIDGDGKSDLVIMGHQTSTDIFSFYLSSLHPSGQFTSPDFTQIGLPMSSTTGPFECAVGDFDGDGIQDLVVYYPIFGQIFYYKYDAISKTVTGYQIQSAGAQGWQVASDFTVPQDLLAMYQIFSVDINGDGRKELLLTAANDYYLLNIEYNGGSPYAKRLAINNDLSFGKYPGYPATWGGNSINIPCSATIYPGDFNGDGKTDILIHDNFGHNPDFSGAHGNDWYIAYSNGYNGFSPLTSASNILTDKGPAYGYQFTPNYQFSRHQYYVADFNGDGIDDILDEHWSTPVCKSSCPINAYKYAESADLYIDVYFMNGNVNAVMNQTGGFTHRNLSFPQSSYLFPHTTIGPQNQTLIGDFNGDGKADLLIYSQNYEQCVDPQQGEPSVLFTFDQSTTLDKGVNKVIDISDGFNRTIHINYDNLPDLSTQALPFNKYLKGNTATFPLEDIQWPLYVTSSTLEDNGIGTQNTKYYAYFGGQYHLQGKGLIGFLTNSVVDYARNNKTTNIYSNNNGFFDNLLQEKQTIVFSDNTPIDDKFYQFSTSNTPTQIPPNQWIHNNYLSQLTDNDQLHGTQLNTQWTQDDFGNITDFKVFDGGNIIQIHSQTSYTTGAIMGWGGQLQCLPLVTQTQTTRIPDIPYTTNASFSYNPLDQKTTTLYNNGQSTYHYDIYGNLADSSFSSGSVNRSNTFQYDPFGRFVTQQTNALGQSIYFTHDDAYGNVLTSTDLNGLITQYSYDGFGRLAQTVMPTGQTITTTRNNDLSSGIPNSLYFVQVQQANAPTNRQYFDKLDSNLRNQETGFDGTDINTDMVYNNIGQLVRKTEPYYTSNSVLTSTFTYDNFLRPATINDVAGGVTTFSYTYGSNTAQSVFTASGAPTKTITKSYDVTGLLTSVADNAGTVSYTYASCGRPNKILMPGGAVTTMTYNSFGWEATLNDADAGLTTYQYDPVGEVTYQQTALQARSSSYTTYSYDNLGRVLTENELVTGEQTTYNWDPVNGIGQIGSISYNTGTQGNWCTPSSSNISYLYTYNSLGQLYTKTLQLPSGSYTTTFNQYDPLNRLTQMTYPDNFQINQSYTTTGYLNLISDALNNPIWQCTAMSQYGTIISANEGINVTTSKSYDNLGFLQSINFNQNSTLLSSLGYNFNDATGNLMGRSSYTKNFIGPGYFFLSETFNYDALDRLTQAVSGQSNPTLTMGYDASGNITSKSDIGNYHYNHLPAHSVSGITSATSLAPTQQQNADYTSFNMASDIKENGYELDYTYGPDHKRVMANLISGCPAIIQVENIVYDDNYEVVNLTSPSSTYENNYVTSPDGLIAIDVKQPSSVENLYYIQTDHLGSITNIYSNTGSFVYGQSFDAWGNYRSILNWNYLSPSSLSVPSWLIRGYTGHEQLNQFGLINMNGRMYDPLIARILSPDAEVQAYDNTQNYNRYSYCLNNPLKFTDPTGMDWVTDPNGNTYWDANVNSQWDFAYYYPSGTYTYDGQTVENAVDFQGNLFNGDANGDYNYVPVQLGSVTITGNKYDPWGYTNGSFVDEFTKAIIRINQYNPAAWSADVSNGYVYGTDRFGNTQSLLQTNLKLVSLIPIFSIEAAPVEVAVSNAAKYTVYVGQDVDGIIRYVGHTGRAPAIRYAEHEASETVRSFLDFDAVGTFNTRLDARIYEQSLINSYGGVGGGQLFNQINSVSPKYWGLYGIH